MDVGVVLAIVAVSFIASLAIVFTLKSSLKNARANNLASFYVDEKSFEITKARDIYLNTTVSRVRIRDDGPRMKNGKR